MSENRFSADVGRYDGRMPYQRCGESGLQLPELSLGFWHNFGDGDDPVEYRRLMHRAFDGGITHFDFANNYGPPAGSAERNCGELLKKDFAAHRDELVISTKAAHEMWAGPYGSGGSRKHLLSSLDQSLARLQVDYVDIFYAHCPTPETPLEETMGALVTAVKSGRALYAGISKYPLPMLKDAVEILESHGVPLTIYQPPYSLLNQKVDEDGILAWLHEQGIGSIVFSPLAQGMLTDKYLTRIPEGSRAARAEGFLQLSQVEAQRESIIGYHAEAQAAGQSLQHYALRWVLKNPAVTSALVGARSVAQLEDLLQAVR